MNSSNEHYQKIVEKKNKTRFASCGYDDRFNPFILNKVPALRQLYGDLFQEFLGDSESERLLDLGCGTGVYFDVLSPFSRRIDAIDSSGDMTAIAGRYCKESGLSHIQPITAGAGAIPFADESFDTVIELDVLHHLTDIDGALAEVYRVLKPGGRFFVFEPNINNPLTFFAHLIPPEERAALRLNRPKKLVSVLEKKFHSRKWRGVCGLITQTTGIKRVILDAYLGIWRLSGWQSFFPRQGWLGVKE